MTLETLFIVLIPLYLVVIAYSIVGSRRRGTPGRVRAISSAVIVLAPPVAILIALYSTGDAFLIAGWSAVALAMLASGAATAVFTEYMARRTGA